MRKAITNNEQTHYIRNRWEFYTRQGVYRGYTDPRTGDYELWHWQTLIASFNADGTVYLNPYPRTATTNRYRWDIVHAMTPEERVLAYAGVARQMHAEARRYPALFSSKSWRDMLARFDWALDVLNARTA